MALNAKGKRILKVMRKHYGKEKGEKVFYAMIKENKLDNVEKKAKK